MKLGLFFLFYFSCFSLWAGVNPLSVIQPFHSVDKSVEDDEDLVKVRCTRFKQECFGDKEKHDRYFYIPKSVYLNQQHLAQSVFTARSSSDELSHGTAFLVGKNLVLTNRHVFKPNDIKNPDCGSFEITRAYSLETIACKKPIYCSPSLDMCLIEMQKLANGKELGDELEILKLSGTSSEKEFNDLEKEFTVIGNPGHFEIVVSTGKHAQKLENQYIGHGVPVLEGSSGSPMFNQKNEVVGLITAQDFVHFGPEIQNYSIPANIIKFILESLGHLKQD